MIDFENERNEYKAKVAKQRDAIENLLALAETHTGLFEAAIIRQLRDYRKKCDKIYQKLDKNEFEIAIVGLEKAGKSTFGNALMENRILPDADERCTYTSTCIRYGPDRAVVKFFTGREMDEVLRGYLGTLGVENAQSYTYQTLTLADYKMLFSKLDQRDQERYENTVNQDVINLLENKGNLLSTYVGKADEEYEGEDLYGKEFQSFIVDPKVAVAVKEVCIESSRLGKLENAVIYDVPGFDSPTSMHLEQTKARMKEADAIMLIASAEKPSFTAPALKMFQEVVDEDNVSLGDKLFIFGNRADGATTLSRNIQTLKNEAQRWNLLRGAQLEERMMIGSAKAHLQAKGIVAGDDCINKIREDVYCKAWPYGDGIEYAYQKLVQYNENERFDVIKRKIRRNNEELQSIFKGLMERYTNGSYSVDYGRLLKETTKLKDASRKAITKKLEELRDEIRTKYSTELILSKRLEDIVRELFENDTKYVITDEDIRNASLKIDDVGGAVNVEKVEEFIREEKFKQIYGDFSESAFKVANADHSAYYTRVIEIFETALNVNKKSRQYEKIHNMIATFVEQCKRNTEDEFIYQSLIERFVRDVVEVLIRRPYTSEARLNKFVEAAEIFSGLILFYNPGDANEGYKRQFLSVAPKNQPLLLALVFHNYKQSDECSNSIMRHLGGICNLLCENPEVIQLVYSIVKLDPFGGEAAIKKMIDKNRFKAGKPVDEYLRSVIPDLREIKRLLSNEGASAENFNNTKKYDFDFTNIETFEQQYKEFFGGTPRRTYDNVREFFDVDLDILEKFLIHASIPAIRFEKPFVSREVQSINHLLDLVGSTQYDAMIDSNSEYFLPGVHETILAQIDNSIANKAVLAEVEKILKTIDSNT